MTEKQRTILEILSNCPLIDTDQVATLYDCKYPNKRASEALVELERCYKLIEGCWENHKLAKVWRLSKKGRTLMGVDRLPVPLTGHKVDHNLSLTDIWMHLKSIGKIKRWKTELREPFGDKNLKYCPDAFCCIEAKSTNHFLMIETQLSPLTTNNWAKKWGYASTFFESAEFKTASFQDFRKDGKPVTISSKQFKILVVSTQQPETIQAGTRLPLIIVRDIHDLRI